MTSVYYEQNNFVDLNTGIEVFVAVATHSDYYYYFQFLSQKAGQKIVMTAIAVLAVPIIALLNWKKNQNYYC